MNTESDTYTEDINFVELAQQDPDFAKVLKPNGQVDFSDPASVQQLTKSLLKRDFRLQITLPPNRLCPPVPNRLKYLLWIQDLLDTSNESLSEQHDPKREVLGLDVGTGASCIYPLLACVRHPEWRFVATDIDELSLQYAEKNIQLNNLASRIKLHASSNDGPLFPMDVFAYMDSLTFTMCNPPFYASESELLRSAEAKSRPPSSACTGSASEMIYPGGEVAFVTRMIDESTRSRTRVQWYSSMVGKYSSIGPIIQQLKDVGVKNWATMEFVQGSRTRRWGIAWSFGTWRPRNDVARGIRSLGGTSVPMSSEYNINFDGDSASVGPSLVAKLNETLSELDLQWQWRPSLTTGIGFAAENVWSRAARRKTARSSAGQEMLHNKRRDDGDEDEDEDDDERDDMAFGFKVQITGRIKGDTPGVIVSIRWLKGDDSILFESFCGMIKRKLEL